jgi:hypothetical protein
MECYKEVDETPVIFAISSVYVVQTNKVYTVERLISCSSTMYRNIYMFVQSHFVMSSHFSRYLKLKVVYMCF